MYGYLDVVTRWDVGQGIRLENMRELTKERAYCFYNKRLAVMEQSPRILRKLTISHVYKHLDLESDLKLKDIEFTNATMDDIRKQNDTAVLRTSSAITFSEFLAIVNKVPDYYRLLYLGSTFYHFFICSKDWLILGGVKTKTLGNLIPVPS